MSKRNQGYKDDADHIFVKDVKHRKRLCTKLIKLVRQVRNDKKIKSNAKLFDEIIPIESELGIDTESQIDARVNIDRETTPKKLRILKGQYINNALSDTAKGNVRIYIPMFLAFLWKYDEKTAWDYYQKVDESLKQRPYDHGIEKSPYLSGYEETEQEETQDSSTTRDWLSPYKSIIPFTGREKEIESLNRFANDESAFKLWAITGHSGAGKTRLAVEWLRTSDTIASWDKIILETHNSNHMNPEYWSKWIPDKSTVLVIDYMFNFSKIILEIVNCCHASSPKGGLPHNVRLLILNHILPENYKDWINDPETGFQGMSGSRFDQLRFIFFEKNPLNLSKTDSKDQNEIIHNIITKLAGSKVQSRAVENAKKHLRSMKEAWHPLFAALVGHALKENQDYRQWSRMDLIHHYLTGDERALWQKEGEEGQWAACWIAVATARHGISFDLLREYLPENISRKSVKNLCNRIVSAYGVKELPAFQPPILGENFFLLFLENLPDFENRYIAKEFHEMLSTGDPELQISSALAFVDFIDKLVRNLCIEKPKDNQEKEKIDGFWQVLLDFLQPKNFPKDSHMQWAVSVALTGIFATKKEKYSKEKIENILRQVDFDAICAVKERDLLEKSLIAAMTYFEYSQKYSNKIAEKLLWFVQDFYMMEQDIDGDTALILTCYNSHKDMVQYLIEERKAKVDETNNIWGRTALMIAIENGHEDMVRRFVKNCNAEVDKVNNDGITALMLASEHGHKTVVQTLIEEGCAKIDKTNRMGMTALMWASMAGYKDVVQILIEKGMAKEVGAKKPAAKKPATKKAATKPADKSTK